MSSHGKKIFDGIEYDLTYLDSAVIDVVAQSDPDVSFRVLVSYGHHCFAREVRDDDPEHNIITGEVIGDAFVRLERSFPNLCPA